MSEKFCLKWNDFQSNASKSFGLFRNEAYLHDVTLVSDDQKQVSAHMLVLSASSEYFKNIFKLNSKPNAHPMVCLEGISADNLNNIIDYIYNGEVKIYQENLDRFLSIAQRLKLEGLIGNNDDVKAGEWSESESIITEKNEETTDILSNDIQSLKKEPQKQTKAHDVKMNEKVMVPVSSNDVSEVENTVNQYIEKCEDGSVRCTVCGKVDVSRNKWQNLRSHIETHLEGFSYPCQLCGKTFRSRHSYNNHKCFKKIKNNK